MDLKCGEAVVMFKDMNEQKNTCYISYFKLIFSARCNKVHFDLDVKTKQIPNIT